MRDVATKLRNHMQAGGAVTIDRPFAELILDQLEGRGLTAQQKMLFNWLSGEDEPVTSSDIKAKIGADSNEAGYLAVWRLAKALERSSLPYRVRSIVGVGYKLERVDTHGNE